ncbi:hypothetical protein OG948_56625 (plasmid) [Embleya sp. NBC_00888]|uniref:hypothetical protein n=1 Tax=Embleya sp. NBC_00888 TaxID=2975960 RepID=UPI002F90CF53|nr:hypothetical protein OG948_56625 [Embleya sp. NBC_00888]
MVRAYLPHTVRAYAHDLQKLLLASNEVGLRAQEFTPFRPTEFLRWLRLVPARRAQRLELGAAAGTGYCRRTVALPSLRGARTRSPWER